MVNEHIVRAIADASCFLEFTKPPTLDEDAAVAALEQLSYQLCQADDQTKSHLARAFEEISSSYGDRAYFVRSLPESFGLR